MKLWRLKLCWRSLKKFFFRICYRTSSTNAICILYKVTIEQIFFFIKSSNIGHTIFCDVQYIVWLGAFDTIDLKIVFVCIKVYAIALCLFVLFTYLYMFSKFTNCWSHQELWILFRRLKRNCSTFCLAVNWLKYNIMKIYTHVILFF